MGEVIFQSNEMVAWWARGDAGQAAMDPVCVAKHVLGHRDRGVRVVVTTLEN